jgi:hypothetical protein
LEEKLILILSDEYKGTIYICIYSVMPKLIGNQFGSHIDNAEIISDVAALLLTHAYLVSQQEVIQHNIALRVTRRDFLLRILARWWINSIGCLKVGPGMLLMLMWCHCTYHFQSLVPGCFLPHSLWRIPKWHLHLRGSFWNKLDAKL